ncbi:MAG: isochorismatase family protein [Actinomycetia bacterium]|nr:isochorismatase family protein [Actinomycetes bacterium]
MAVEFRADDEWLSYGFGENPIEPGERPAVLVVDFQCAFTQPREAELSEEWDHDPSPLIDRGVTNTARVLAAARSAGVPVFQTVVAFREDGTDVGMWTIKIPRMRELVKGSKSVQVDGRVWDESDILLVKNWPSIFAGTPLPSLLAAHQRDTVIVTGCTTSGCIRATTIDAFTHGYRTLVPEDCVGDWGEERHVSNLRDVHCRYAEVTRADTVIEYLSQVSQRITAA